MPEVRAIAYLHDHHMAVEGAAGTGFERAIDASADLGDYWTSDSHVWDEVAVHDIDVEPIGALLHLLGAVMAEVSEVGAENGGSDNGGRRSHGV